MKTLRDIPVLSGQTWDGHSSEFRKSRGEIFLRIQRELGDIGAIRFFNVPIVVLSSPELVHEALIEKAKSFEKSLATKMMFYPFAGKGLFTSEGELWRRQRKLMAPLFHPGAVSGYASQMNAVITRCLDRWRDGEVIDVGKEMTRITMAVVGKVLFDADTSDEADEIGAAIRVMFDHLADQAGSLSIVLRATLAGALLDLGSLPPSADRLRSAAIDRLVKPLPLPTTKSRRVRNAVKLLDRTVQRMIDERRRAGRERDDLLSRLLAARDEDDGSLMSDRQVRDEAVTLFVAGHETTATGMTWALYFLSRRPDVYRRWKAEVRALDGRMPTAEDAARLEYSRGIFKEAIRLYPPAFAFDRIVVEDVVIGDYLLPRKTAIIIAPYAIHRREASWPDAERFDPTRFAAESEAMRPRAAYLPFGLGPRVCIGASFAQLEAELLLAQIAQRFEFEPMDLAPVGPSFVTALRPDRAVMLRVRAQAGAAAHDERPRDELRTRGYDEIAQEG